MSAPFGSLQALMDVLVPLEETIDPDHLRVSRWRPVKIDPPHLYNWINPSPADIPATQMVRDEVNLSVRIIVRNKAVEDITAAIESYWDKARNVIDADLVNPGQSALRASAVMARRTTMRNIVDVFNDVEFLGLELVLQAELRRQFA